MRVGRPRSPLLGISLGIRLRKALRFTWTCTQMFLRHCRTQRSLPLKRSPPLNLPTRPKSPCHFLTLSQVPHPEYQSYLIPLASVRFRPRGRCPGYIVFDRSTTTGNVTLCWEHPLLLALWISRFYYFSFLCSAFTPATLNDHVKVCTRTHSLSPWLLYHDLFLVPTVLSI